MVAAIDVIDTGMRGGPDPAVVDDNHAFRVPLRLGECHVGGRDRERCVLIDKNWPHARERLRPIHHGIERTGKCNYSCLIPRLFSSPGNPAHKQS